MRYTVRTSIIDVVGHIWQPGLVCSMRYTLSPYDLANIKAEAQFQRDNDTITREDVEHWLSLHSGDFQSIIDFSASLEDGRTTVDFPWATEDGECQYLDTLGGDP